MHFCVDWRRAAGCLALGAVALLGLTGCELKDTTTGTNAYDIGTENENTNGQVAISNGGSATGGTIGVATTYGSLLPKLGSVPPTACGATGYVAVDPNCSADGQYVAVAGGGATSDYGPVAVTIFGPAVAPWGVAIAPGGTAYGNVAISAGDATGGAAAVSILGNASSAGACYYNGLACTGPTAISGGSKQVVVDGKVIK